MITFSALRQPELSVLTGEKKEEGGVVSLGPAHQSPDSQKLELELSRSLSHVKVISDKE